MTIHVSSSFHGMKDNSLSLDLGCQQMERLPLFSGRVLYEL